MAEVDDTRHRSAFWDGGAVLNLPLFYLEGIYTRMQCLFVSEFVIVHVHKFWFWMVLINHSLSVIVC